MNTYPSIRLLALFVALSSFMLVKSGVKSSPDSLILVKQLSEITVSGILNSKLNLPVETVTTRDIETKAMVSPAELLHQVPGLTMTRDGAWATSVNLRGFSEAKLLFLSDGDRIHTASDIAGALSAFDLGSTERIEIVKGAGSVLFGTGALGGVINFVSKRPAYSELRKVSGRAALGFQTVNSLLQGNAAVSVAEDNWYLQIDGALRKAQNYTTPLGPVTNSQFNDANFALRGAMRYDNDQELLVGYQHYEAWNVGLPGGGAFPPTASVRYLGFVRNQLNGEYVFTDLSDLISELRFKAYTQNITREVENIVNPATAIFPGSVNRTSGGRATADLYFNDYHTLTIGAEGWVRDQATTRIRITTAGDTIFTAEQPTPRATMANAGIFGQYRWVVDPNRWNINTGMRIDYIRTQNDTAFKEVYKYKLSKGERTTLPHNSTVLFADRTTQELAYAAHVDVEYRPARAHRFVWSMANAYRAASMEERFKYIDQQGILRVGNPNLRPEKGLNANLGYTFSLPRFYLKTDVFASYLFDMIAETMGSYKLSGGQVVPAWVNTNVDEAVYYGAELELKWLFVDGFDVETSVAYVYAEDRSTALPMPMLPPLNGSVKLNYHLARKLNSSLLVEWEYQTAEPAQGTERHRYAVVNWLFDTAPRRLGTVELRFTGGVRNLLNTEYKAWFSTLRGVNRLEPGRNIYLQALLGF
jgi:hemoglobin/transferrin/lactoferrin receptor protein